jgi:peroxiredoxin
MKKTAIFLIILFLSAAAFALSKVPVPDKASVFTLKDLSGQTVSLNSYMGKVVLLVFFQTWCPVCQDEMPQLESIYKKYRSKDFDVLAIDMRESAEIVRLFASENKLSFKILLDEKGSVSAAYKVRFIPRIFILDRSGAIKFDSYYIQADDLERELKKSLK